MSHDSTAQSLSETNRAGALTFAMLFAIESLSRAFNASVLSVQAYDLLGSSQRVSVLSIAVSLMVLCATLSLPYFLGGLRRRWTYSIGAILMIAACLALASYTVAGQVLGAFLRNTGAAILNVTLSLYIMDNIRKADLTRSEPLRLTLLTVSWMVGPFSGVWLYQTYGSWAPQAASVMASLLLLVVFWRLRLKETKALPSGSFERTSPLANVKRFAGQPRLRLAWAIALGRSCFWATLFTYGPLLMIEGGLGVQAGGLLISASQAMLLFAFVFGRLAQQVSVRTVIVVSFVTISFCLIGAGLAGRQNAATSALLLLVASLFATGLDAVGGIPFLRAVRFGERQRMASVYRTFIEFSELLPGVIFAIVLTQFETAAVFTVLGLSILGVAALSWRYVPKSM